MNSLIIYDKLPEDINFDYYPNLNQFDVYKKIYSIIINETKGSYCKSAEESIDIFASLYAKVLNDGYLIELELLYELARYCIESYKLLLKSQRLNIGVNNIIKSNCQIFNYYLQNILSFSERDNNEKENYEFVDFSKLYKVWDACYDERVIYTVDSADINNFKVYDLETRELVYSDSTYLPTKCNYILGKVYIHSTYSEYFSVIDISSGVKKDFKHSCVIRVIYEYDNDVYIVDDCGDILKISSCEGIILQYISKISLDGYFIDSYINYKDIVYCTSHTSNQVYILDLCSLSTRFECLEKMNMPNSIEVVNDEIYVCDKETGYVSLYDIESFKLIKQFGFFSKNDNGNADTIKLLNIKGFLYVFSWLKNKVSVVKVS